MRTPDFDSPTTSLRVLVVDDDIESADVFAELLVSLGHQVQVAYDGAAGLSIDSTWQPDVVFLDLGLPTIDGYEVAERLRARRREKLRIVALTGFGQPADLERSRSAGCQHHLVKPARLSDILQALADRS
jgi:CheY-like chemotaxis protein